VSGRVLVTRATDQAGPLALALLDRGLEPVLVPAIEVTPAPARTIAAAVRNLRQVDWVVVTSANAVVALGVAGVLAPSRRPSTRWAAVGDATAAALEREGIGVGFMPAVPTATALASELPILPGQRALVVHGDLAGEAVEQRLRARGAQVTSLVAYDTREAPASSRPLLRAAFAAGRPVAAILTSGSTGRGLLALGAAEGIDVLRLPTVCAGPLTADEARRAGFAVLAVAPAPDADTLAATAAAALAAEHLETR
jgi:uroporphyrinogen III methyltransferase/synthase